MPIITAWNAPRPTKRLLILDIDRTLGDFKDPRTTTIRKHLKYFLTKAYKYYDIAIWSNTCMEALVEKLTCMDMLNNKRFKLLFALDETYTTAIKSLRYGNVMVKPLSVIWENFNQYNEKNTIIVDDQRKNFFHNQKNGLEIMPFYKQNYGTDDELLLLTEYLKILAKTSINFSQENLLNWKLYIPYSCK